MMAHRIPAGVNTALDDQMQAGYHFFIAGDKAGACRVWLPLWDGFRDLARRQKVQSAEELDDLFEGMQCVSNWCQDLENSLDESRSDPDLLERGLRFVQEFQRCLPATYPLILVNMGIAEAEFHLLLGRPAECEKTFERLIQRFPQSPWPYARWGDLLDGVGHLALQNNPQRAREIWTRGRMAEVEDLYVLMDRLNAEPEPESAVQSPKRTP